MGGGSLTLDVPRGRSLSLSFDQKLLFGKILTENCMNMKEIGSVSGSPYLEKQHLKMKVTACIYVFVFDEDNAP